MDPATSLAIGKTILGGLGVFGRKKSAQQKAAEDQLAFQGRVGQEAYQLAHNYDPIESERQAVKHASDVAASTLNDTLTRQRMNFGGRIDDTRFLPIAQRSADDVLNPLSSRVAEATASAPMKKMQALNSAMQIARPGELAQTYRSMESQAPSASLGMFADGIDELISHSAAQQHSRSVPAAPGGGMSMSYDAMPSYALPTNRIDLTTKRRLPSSMSLNYSARPKVGL